ncbi:hybrid sensor histidine kinase/response regulator [Undibacterium terreum]|nr:response regulator [Undibacterium terreum]
MTKDPYRYFRIEARELLDQLSAGVLDLEKSGTTEKVLLLFRLAHTLKGAAHVVRQAEIANLAHAMEDALSPYRQDGTTIPRAIFDGLLAGLDRISVLLNMLQPAEENTSRSTQDALQQTGSQQLQDQALDGKPGSAASTTATRIARTDVSVIDALLEGIAEVSGELSNMKRLNASVSHIRELFFSFTAQLAVQNRKEQGHQASPAALAKVAGLAEGLRTLIVSAERNIAASTESMERELRQVHDTAERLRLIPVASIFPTLERSTRDAANSLAKKVVLDAGGGDIRLDGQVLDVIQSALVQIIRNAVAHGIENPAERKAAGKPVAGKILLEVTRRGNLLSFVCSDDGRGIDADAVRRAIVRKELAAGTMNEKMEREIEALSTPDLLAILMKGGISTAKTVTELAGRGVGLDLVRSLMQQADGEILTSTVAGKGTRMEMLVPVSLASLQALIVESAGQSLAIPLDAVSGTLRVAAKDIVRAEQGRLILYQEVLIPLITLSLAERRHSTRATAPAILSVVVIRTAAGLTAVAVDKLCGTESIVLRPLPTLAPASAMVSASFLDHQGNPQLVLNPDMLVSGMNAAAAHAGNFPAPLLPILVIDDSLTTRMLESSILEAAGFDVALAASAEEGLEMARNNRYALFLVDLEMPGMNGFQFITQVRADAILHAIPCILVTSRDAEEDKLQAKQAGADAYIVKGEFNQVEFLQKIKQLVQG